MAAASWPRRNDKPLLVPDVLRERGAVRVCVTLPDGEIVMVDTTRKAVAATVRLVRIIINN